MFLRILVTILPSICIVMSYKPSSTDSWVKVRPWGMINGREVKMFTLKNNRNQEIDVINYGATIISIRTPDKNNQIADIVLGFDNIDDYISPNNPYFGATVGRVANRIGRAEFTLDGVKYCLSKNEGNNTLHGGFNGWNTKIWETKIANNSVIMTLLSEDGDEGFPGNVIVSVNFELNDDGEISIRYKAMTTKKTPINLTNHSYFNLAGHGTNADELYKHRIQIIADKWTVTDAENIPTGEIRSVDNSIMDLRNGILLGDVINKISAGGYDNNFCMSKSFSGTVKLIARVDHEDSGRYMTVYTDQPGVQFYTANNLLEKGSKSLSGKGGVKYFKHAAFCLETQNYPDAINHENFPDSILQPGDVYENVVIYKVGVLQK